MTIIRVRIVKGTHGNSYLQSPNHHESGASFSTSRSEPGIMGEGFRGGGAGAKFWLVFAAAQQCRADFRVVAQEAFSR